MAEIVMKQRFAAPAEKVFAAITDHEGMGDWLSGASVKLEREGSPDRNGLGAVRNIRARGLTIVEEVVRFEPPVAMDYKIIRGGPIQDHLGTIRIEPRGENESGLEWRIRFGSPWWAGGEVLAGVVAKVLGSELRAGLERLAKQVS